MTGHLTKTVINMMSNLKTVGTKIETSIAHMHPNSRADNLVNTIRTEIIQIFSKYLVDAKSSNALTGSHKRSAFPEYIDVITN